jgi:hypothetical protein
MFDRMVVQESLNRTWALESCPGWAPDNSADDQSSVTSQLIYDIFGGDILKTHKKRGWHFYNRINGERIDFTRLESGKNLEDYHFDDIPSTPGETNLYFEQEEYFTFLASFITVFEEAVGLEKYLSVSAA